MKYRELWKALLNLNTKSVLRSPLKQHCVQMILPGLLALGTPVLIGFGLKGVFDGVSSAEILGGVLAGVTVSGVLMAMFQSNSGGAWDNAKNRLKKVQLLAVKFIIKVLMHIRLPLREIPLVILLKTLPVLP